MTREEAKEFGNIWLEMNEDCKDSSTYAFFQMAIKALELTDDKKEIYAKGYKDGQEALAFHLELCKEEQEPILDKIRAEIQEYADNKAEPTEMRAYYRCLQIIDKYRTESEE